MKENMELMREWISNSINSGNIGSDKTLIYYERELPLFFKFCNRML